MVFVLPALLILSLIGIRLQKCNSKENTYLTKSSSNSIRGIFIILIFTGTFIGRISDYNMFDGPMVYFVHHYEQLLYVPLFFYSGFGIFETFKNNGREYARKIPLQQILRHYIAYFISWILLAMTALALHSKYSIQDYLLSLLGISDIGNPTNWFVFVMIFLYLFSFISFRIADKKTAVIINIVLTIFLFFMYRTFAPAGSPYLWNTMPAYVFGILYSYFKDRIEQILFKNKFNRFIFLFASFGLLVASLFAVKQIPYSDFRNAAFIVPSFFMSLMIVSFTSIVNIRSKALNFIGANYFWIFILQQISLIWLTKVGFIYNQKYVYFLVGLAIAIGLGVVLNKVFNHFWNIFAKNHGEASEESNIQLGIAISYIALLVSTIGAFVVTPRILENLGDRQYGLFSFANSITAWLTVITSALAASYVRFAAKHQKENKDVGIVNTSYIRIFSISALIMLAIIGAGLGIMYGCGFSLGQYSAAENQLILILILISGINVSLNVMFSVFNNFLTYKKQFIFLRTLALTISFLTFACNLIFSFITKSVLSVAIVAAVMTAISSLITIFYAFRKERMTFAKVSFKESSVLLKSIIAFSGFILLNAVVDRINGELDKTLLGIMVNAEAVTDYTLSKYLTSYFLTLSVAISSTYVPRIHELVANNDKQSLSALFLKISRSQMMVMFLVGGGFAAVGLEFMNLWLGAEKEYIYYYSLIPIALDMFTLTVNSCIEVQRAMNKHKFRAILYIGLASLNIALTILLIKVLPSGYEIWGAFIGTATSIVLGNIITLNIYNKVKIGLPMGSYFISAFKHVGYASVGLGAALAERIFIGDRIGVAAKLLLQGSTFVILYVAMLFIFERKTFIPVAKKLANKVKTISKAKQADIR